ncbi:hypothetical protein ACWFRF_30180 [Nocardia sp. NPDC055165]
MAVSKALPLAIGDQRHRRAPGPPALPLAGALYGAGYLLGGEGLGHKLFDYYGSIVAVPILGFGRVVLVNDPELVKQVGRTRVQSVPITHGAVDPFTDHDSGVVATPAL